MKQTEITCEFCGAEFIARRTDARYCSGACKQQAYLERLGGPRISSTKCDRGRITAHLMLLLNKFITVASHDLILRIELEDLKDQLSRLQVSIPDHQLPDHVLLIKNVKTITESLLYAMDVKKHNGLLTGNLKEFLSKHLKGLNELSKTVVTYVYPRNSFE